MAANRTLARTVQHARKRHMDTGAHALKVMEVLDATLILMNVLVLLVQMVAFVSTSLVNSSAYVKQDTAAIDAEMVSTFISLIFDQCCVYVLANRTFS